MFRSTIYKLQKYEWKRLAKKMRPLVNKSTKFVELLKLTHCIKSHTSQTMPMHTRSIEGVWMALGSDRKDNEFGIGWQERTNSSVCLSVCERGHGMWWFQWWRFIEVHSFTMFHSIHHVSTYFNRCQCGQAESRSGELLQGCYVQGWGWAWPRSA